MVRETGDRQENRYASWDTDDLIYAITVNRQDYMPEVLIAMESEIANRGIDSEYITGLQDKIKSDTADQDRHLNGIWGFLLVFIVGFGLNIIINLSTSIVGISNISYKHIHISLLNVIAMITVLFVFAYSIFTFIILTIKRNHAPRHASIWLIINWLVTISVYVIEIIRGTGDIPLYGIILLSMWTLIWLQYFSKSRRVAITYNIQCVT